MYQPWMAGGVPPPVVPDVAALYEPVQPVTGVAGAYSALVAMEKTEEEKILERYEARTKSLQQQADPKKLVPQVCDGNYNMNASLANCIKQSQYYNQLLPMTSYDALVDEMVRSLNHLEPYIPGRRGLPSTAFSILFRMFVLQLTYNQVNALLYSKKGAKIRAMGLLYLRFVGDPNTLWEWYSPLLCEGEDEDLATAPESNTVLIPGADGKEKMSLGRYAGMLLTETKYYDTYFKRFPITLENKFKKHVLLCQLREERRKKNEAQRRRFVKGTNVEAEYCEDGVMGWYDAVIEEECDDGNFMIIYDGYDTLEKVDISMIKLKPKVAGSVSSSERGGEKGRSGSRSGDYRRDSQRDKDYERSYRSSSRNRGGRERSRSRDRDRARDRRGDRYDDRRRRSRSRSRSRDRDRDRRRSRDRYSGSRDDEYSRRRRSRSRSRSRSRGRDRRERDRSRSRDRNNKGYDRDRRREEGRSRSRDRDYEDRYKQRDRSHDRDRERERERERERDVPKGAVRTEDETLEELIRRQNQERAIKAGSSSARSVSFKASLIVPHGPAVKR